MPFAQKAIPYALGPSRAAVEAAPAIEGLVAAGQEVLFLTDPVDEWAMQRMESYDGRPLKAVDRGDADLSQEDEEAAGARKAKEAELSDLLEAARESLDDYVKEVHLSPRLQNSPAVLLHEEGALSPQVEATLRAMGQPVPERKRILELNPDHPVLAKLKALHEQSLAEGPAGEEARRRFHLTLELLHGQALMAEGSPVPDPARFAKLITRLLAPDEGGEGEEA
jgi:molecular chaperone HtpG